MHRLIYSSDDARGTRIERVIRHVGRHMADQLSGELLPLCHSRHL